MSASSNRLVNEVVLLHRGCVIRYRGGHLNYECSCEHGPHVFTAHSLWLREHEEHSESQSIQYVCSHCGTTFSSIRSVAQHHRHCELAAQIADLVPEPDASARLVPCSFCADFKARNKRGLMRHIHRSHPIELFNKYTNEKLLDRRWTKSEVKILSKATYKFLAAAGLPLIRSSVKTCVRSVYLEVEPKIAKSYEWVRKFCLKNAFLDELVKRDGRISRRQQAPQVEMEADDSGHSLDSSCDCLKQIIRETGALFARLNVDSAERRMQRKAMRDLSRQPAEFSSRMLRNLYERCGEKIEGSLLDDPASSRRRGQRSLLLNDNMLFKKIGSKAYVSHLLDPALRDLIPSDEAVEWFSRQFERPSIDDVEPIHEFDRRVDSTCCVHKFISAEEVELHRSTFDNNTASGTDGFTAVNLKSAPVLVLTIMMNSFLLAGDVPHQLKVNRTTLLAKKPQPGPTDWRPITVSSVVYRLFSKIITERLARVTTLSPHQRAFSKGIDGCGENIVVIARLLKEANAGKGPMFLCSLDLAKAFDSVSFSSIRRALLRKGVDNLTLSLLGNMLEGNVSVVSRRKEANITRGVRQGDPISPLLFNLVIDELFIRLKDSRYGATYKKRDGTEGKFSAVAFADDITLLCDSQRDLERQLSACMKFFTARGMRINITKSSCLAIKRIPGSDVCTPLPVTIGLLNPDSGALEQLPCLGPEDTLRVLGAYLNPLGKVLFDMGRLSKLLDLVKDSPVERYYKVEIIRNHIVMSFRFQVVYGGVRQTVARKADQLIRKCIRKIMGLPSHTSDSFIHSTKSSGGLGVERLEFAASCLRVKTLLRLLASDRNVTAESISVTEVRDGYLRCNDILGRQEGVIRDFSEDPEILLGQLRGIDISEWYEACRSSAKHRDLEAIKLLPQGAAFHYLSNAPNGYLLEPEKHGLELGKIPLIYAIRLGLFQVLSNRRSSNRDCEVMDTSCRLCHNAIETPMHVMQKCIRTKRWQIERHNAVVALLERELSKLADGDYGKVMIEREISLVIGQNLVRLCPDIVVVRRKQSRPVQTQVAVIEVTCCWERLHGSSLARAYDRKCAKYEPLKAWLKSRDNLKGLLQLEDGGEMSRLLTADHHGGPVSVAICPIVVGVRGGWDSRNMKGIQFLGGNERDLVLMNRIMRTAAERSVNLYKKFMGEVRSEGD